MGAAAVGMENVGGWELEICSLHCFPEQIFGLFCIICILIDGIPAPIKTWIYNTAILLEFLLFKPNLKCFLVVHNTFGYGFFFNGYFYFSHPLFFISHCLIFNHSHYLPPFPHLLLIICRPALSSGFFFFCQDVLWSFLCDHHKYSCQEGRETKASYFRENLRNFCFPARQWGEL